MRGNKRIVLRTTGVAVLLLILFAVIVANRLSAAKAAPTASGGWYNAAPFVMPLTNSPPNLPNVMAASGVKAFTLAFVLANGDCTPAWASDAGLTNVSSDTQMGPIINAIRAAGGDVVVSFGGYGGKKLGEVCGSPQATAAAEQQVIDKYGVRAFDLDLEEPEYENAAAINNELGAAQILQRNNPGFYVSITLPGTTSGGTGYFGQQLLNNAKSLGFTPDNYGIMPFDGGFNGAGSQTDALEKFHAILMNTFGWDSETAYNHEGVSLMNGRSDTGEYFSLADFQTVRSYAQDHHLARFTYWSVNRDRQCNPPDNGTTSGTCSSVAQSDWDFTRIVAQFGGGSTPPPPPPPTPTPAPGQPTPTPTPSNGGGSCAGVAAWNSSIAYVHGNRVTYGGAQWEAKWWSQADVPGGAAGVWTKIGSC